MNNFALEIWDDESRYVTFYTVRRENETDSETDKFYTRFKDDPIYRPALEELTALIFDIIGDREGALDAFFRRQENKAAALPPAKLKSLSLEYPNFPLRLFCFKVSERIVFYLTGDQKQRVLHSPVNVSTSIFKTHKISLQEFRMHCETGIYKLIKKTIGIS